MSEIRLDGRVAIVTGAGQGLGQAYAVALARRGAAVLINDVEAQSAHSVAKAIVDAGGVALPHVGSAQDGQSVVDAAIDHFGRLDILVNNAGILRDAVFHKMSNTDWQNVLDVHLNGTYAVTRAAWPLLREQEWGRVIMTSSIAGVHGNFGQANYATAKLGLFGFAQSLAIEGAHKNIRVNTIAPVAATQLTRPSLSESLLDGLAAEHIAPLIVLLASDECPSTGQLFEAGGGHFAQLRWERSNVLGFPKPDHVAAEDLLQEWKTLQSFDDSCHPSSVADGFAMFTTRFDNSKE